VQVPRTLYFNGAVDGDWDEIGNWWFDAAHTVAATSLPTAADSVVATANITASGQTVANFSLGGLGPALAGTLTVTGVAEFTDSDFFGTVNGNAVFKGVSLSASFAVINGNATFTEDTANDGTVNGDALFSDDSFNFGAIIGTATFTGSACNAGGTAGTFVPNPPPSCF
jgi:hypothetical protein